jgi:hypothetical protein
MNALTVGSLILLWILVVTAIAAYIESQSSPAFTTGISGCEDSDNATVCNDIKQSQFIQAISDTAFSGISGAPNWFNDLYVSIGIFLLILAIMLIVSYFVGLIFGGSA